MRKALATTKVVGRDTTWCGPVSKTQAMARAIVTGCGKDDNGARMLFYKLPDGEGVYGAVEEVRAWHTGRPPSGSVETINVPVPCSNII
jgi:hypothetical protein